MSGSPGLIHLFDGNQKLYMNHIKVPTAGHTLKAMQFVTDFELCGSGGSGGGEVFGWDIRMAGGGGGGGKVLYR